MSNIPATIAAMATGQVGQIGSLTGDVRLRRRLLEMGLCPGTVVRLVRRAPLGDPLVVAVRGYQLSLRAAEATQVVLAAPGVQGRAA